MTIGDIKNMLMPMLEDGDWAEHALEKDDNQFTRRAFIRSLFSIIEGSVWVLKQTLLHASAPKGRMKQLSIAEYAILSETTYDLKNNGQINARSQKLPLPENLKFTAELLAKYFNAHLDLGIGSKAWDNFLKAQRIRNRIAHPKTMHEFEITSEDTAVCQATSSWFNKLIEAFINSLIHNAKNKQK